MHLGEDTLESGCWTDVMQESEAERQDAAADLQRCYEEAATLQGQLSTLAASCQQGADRRVEILAAQLQHHRDVLQRICACAENAEIDGSKRRDACDEEIPSAHGQVRHRSGCGRKMTTVVICQQPRSARWQRWQKLRSAQRSVARQIGSAPMRRSARPRLCRRSCSSSGARCRRRGRALPRTRRRRSAKPTTARRRPRRASRSCCGRAARRPRGCAARPMRPSGGWPTTPAVCAPSSPRRPPTRPPRAKLPQLPRPGRPTAQRRPRRRPAGWAASGNKWKQRYSYPGAAWGAGGSQKKGVGSGERAAGHSRAAVTGCQRAAGMRGAFGVSSGVVGRPASCTGAGRRCKEPRGSSAGSDRRSGEGNQWSSLCAGGRTARPRSRHWFDDRPSSLFRHRLWRVPWESRGRSWGDGGLTGRRSRSGGTPPDRCGEKGCIGGCRAARSPRSRRGRAGARGGRRRWPGGWRGARAGRGRRCGCRDREGTRTDGAGVTLCHSVCWYSSLVFVLSCMVH